jgi:choline kinase
MKTEMVKVRDLTKSDQINSDKTPDCRVVILGAGRSMKGSLPPAMVHVDSARRVLDFLLSSFSALPSAEIDFVAGYMANVVTDHYPEIRFFFNPEWAVSGPVESLTLVPLSSKTSTYVCYSDVLFCRSAIQRMEACRADLVVAVDSLWRKRYEAPSRADMNGKEKVLLKEDRIVDIGSDLSTEEARAQFAGLVKISGPLTSYFERVIRSEELPREAKLSEVIRSVVQDGISASVVDLKGEWAELDAPQDLARFLLGTKAESLERLKPIIRKGKIGNQVSFTHGQWEANPDRVLREIKDAFGDTSLIVRSSALSEDGWTKSSAGAHRSVLDVRGSDARAVNAAVEAVIGSYRHTSPDNQVLVQEMLRDVVTSGVVMTRTPTLGAPYYVISCDSTTSRTDTVTSGEGKEIRTILLHRDSALRPDLPSQFPALMEAVKELEQVVGHDSLDIEFAYTKDGCLHVLQVRPIAAAHRQQPMDDGKIAQSIGRAVEYFCELQRPSPFLVGSTVAFGVMSDWNPAEMIGTKPNRLALSLYRYLITDEAWAAQRAEYGYRDVRPVNLIVDFLGHPYVDLRADFNSFIPASLPDELAGRLVDYYLERLKRSPELHDKVEFDILHTCITFDFEQRACDLRDAGFSEKEVGVLCASLLEITRKGISRCECDLAEIKKMEGRYDAIESRRLAPLEQAYFLLEDVRRIGILLFSHLARNAFVAVSLLKSLESVGCTSADQTEAFLASLRTISSRIQDDARQVARGELPWDDFVERYGHLRPGSYDITSVCYKKAPDEFLRPMLKAGLRGKKRKKTEVWDQKTRQAITLELTKIGLDISFEEFQTFLRNAIEGRELGKFIFTRNLNAALEALADFGAEHGMWREQLAYMRIGELFQLRGANTEDIDQTLRDLARRGKEAYDITQAVCLPGQIFWETDFVCMEQLKVEPNFVTQKNVRAPLVLLNKQVSPSVDISEKIAVIPSADPGYDWLFARNLAGLVTMHGGANSHMAVRAAEFGLPAAIGVGEVLFEKINQSQVLQLDCAGRRIHIVR